MRKVTVDRAIAWISAAFACVRRYPLVFLGMGLIQALIGQIPLLGVVVTWLLGFALTAGVIYAAREVDHGRVPRLGQLFQAFDGQSPLAALVALCLPGVALLLLLVIAVAVLLAGSVGGDAQQLQALSTNPLAILGFLKAHWGALALLLLVTLLLQAMLTFFAVPRVFFDRRGPFVAIADSFRASARNFGTFLLAGVLLALVFIGLGILIGVTVLLPLRLIGPNLAQMAFAIVLGTLVNAIQGPLIYVAWKDVFGAESAASADGVIEAAM